MSAASDSDTFNFLQACGVDSGAVLVTATFSSDFAVALALQQQQLVVASLPLSWSWQAEPQAHSAGAQRQNEPP